jgi:hypothetical protein
VLLSRTQAQTLKLEAVLSAADGAVAAWFDPFRAVAEAILPVVQPGALLSIASRPRPLAS